MLLGRRQKACACVAAALFRGELQQSSRLSLDVSTSSHSQPPPSSLSATESFLSHSQRWSQAGEPNGVFRSGAAGGCWDVGPAAMMLHAGSVHRHYSSEVSADRCWNCGLAKGGVGGLPFLVCSSCKAVQPVDASIDYFQIFGIERGYDIGGANLETKYKDWQKMLHPDLVHTKSEREKSYAAGQSARVIDAYRTLSSQLSRAMYLLQLEGVHVDEEKTLSDPEMLSEVMELREAVEEANNPKALEDIKSEVQGKLEHWSTSFANAFKYRDFEDAITSIRRMTYYDRAIQEIVKKL